MTESVTIEFAAWVGQINGALDAGDYRTANFAEASLGLSATPSTLAVYKVTGQVGKRANY